MKRLNIFILTLFVLGIPFVGANAQTGHWSYDPHAYEYEMAVYYTLVYNDEAVTDMNNYDVAAFSGDECRGVGEVQTVALSGGGSASYGYIRVRSNQAMGENITLMVYDKSLDMECHIIETLTFKSQDLIGMPSSPMTFTFYDERLVTVKVNDATRLYGDTNPEFAITVEGPELVGTPILSCEATATSPIGTYTVSAARGTIKNVNVTFVNGILTVTKTPLTVKAGNYIKKQGEEMPEFVVTYDGFKNEETEDVLVSKPVATTTATKESAPGEYPVTVTGGEAQNYELSYENGILTVTEADPITITANSYNREYGEANPTFEYITSGAELIGTPEITCEATETSPVGTYPITVSQGGITNFNVIYVNGTLTVTKAALTINGGSYTMMQGEVLPEFAGVYSGFKNGETEEVLTTMPTFTTTATSLSEPGTYDVIVSGAEAENYDISYVSGTLTILPRTILIGDVNGDGIVNVCDIVEVVNYIMEKPSERFIWAAADVNNDGSVNVVDIVNIVSIIMAAEYDAPRKVNHHSANKSSTDYLKVDDVELTVSEEKQISIELENTERAYTAFQFDLVLPEGVKIALNDRGKLDATLVAERVDDHTMTVEKLASGVYRFIAFSLSNADFYGTTGPLVNIVLKAEDNVTVGEAVATISAQVFADKDGIQFNLPDATFNIIVKEKVIPQVVAEDKTRLYGDENPEFTYSVTGGEITGTPVLSTDATLTSPVGEYVIMVEKGSVVEDIIPVNGILTVTKAPLTIDGGTYIIRQGEELPTFTATYTGFKNDETEDVLIVKPVFTTTATSSSEPGTYDVVVSGAEAENYEITYVNGTLTITTTDGISSIKNDSRSYIIYTLDGRKMEVEGKALKNLPKGIYIINGKKELVN